MLTPQEDLKANRTARLQHYGVSLSGVISYRLHGRGKLDQNCGIKVMTCIFRDFIYCFEIMFVYARNTFGKVIEMCALM
jgi:hypothetical protein